MHKLMILSQGGEFMIDSLENTLHKSGIETCRAEPDPNSIDENSLNAEMILIYAGDMIKDDAMLLSYIRDLCEKEFMHLCVAGYPNELADIERIIPVSAITCEFERPFDMNEFCDRVSSILLGKMVDDSPNSEKKIRHILLFNNDILFIKKMRECLTPKYKLTPVKSSTQVLSYISNRIPDLIFYDYDMPVTSAPQIMQTIVSEAKNAGIPIIFMTGNTDRENIMNVMYMKPQGYMLKSMGADEICSYVGNFFATGQWKSSH